jgi:hypothetical protein
MEAHGFFITPKTEREIELENKINSIETMLKIIMKKLNIETEKKPVNLVELYGLKPLSFYTKAEAEG